MIAEGISRFLRSAATISVSLCVFFPVLCAGQSATPPPSNPTVFSNPRAASDDPRVGLKGGLYDAGEAAFGMQRIGSLPKPSGFAPGDTVGAPPPPMPAAEGQPPGRPPAQYGSTNSDLAFSGNHLFVGNYNGINFYDIDNPMKVKLRTSLVCRWSGRRVGVRASPLHRQSGQWTDRLRTQESCRFGRLRHPAGPGASQSRGTPDAARHRRPSSPDLRGVRIFDISDLSNPSRSPRYRAPQLPHIPADRPQRQRQRVHLHLGTGAVRRAEELADARAANGRSGPYSASISSKSRWPSGLAKIVSSPRIFAIRKPEP
jgi:hypothetical protein